MARITLIGCGLMAALLGGCALGPSQSEINAAALKEQTDACIAKHKKLSDRFRCFNEAELNIYGRGPHGDLYDVLRASRISVAAKVDSGELSPDDAVLQLTQITARIESERQARVNSRRSVEAQDSMARAAAWQAIQSSQPRPVNCTRIGNSVNCY